MHPKEKRCSLRSWDKAQHHPAGGGAFLFNLGHHDGDAPLIDLQPCGGTHVAYTSEIGGIVDTKIEKKSATTRRVVLGFAP